MIEMIDIKKRYINSDKNIIDGCTATFDIGKRYALFGENGSGKTTFVKILGLLDKNFSGTYRINGKDVLSMSGSDIARLRNEVFGFMFQDNKLLENESAYNNISIPLIGCCHADDQAKPLLGAVLQRRVYPDRGRRAISGA